MREAVSGAPAFQNGKGSVSCRTLQPVLLGDGTEVAHSPTEPVPVWVNRDQRHAYYAAMSYVDEHIGALLQAFDAPTNWRNS